MKVSELSGADNVTETYHYDVLNMRRMYRWDKPGRDISLHAIYYEGITEESHEGWLERQRQAVRQNWPLKPEQPVA